MSGMAAQVLPRRDKWKQVVLQSVNSDPRKNHLTPKEFWPCYFESMTNAAFSCKRRWELGARSSDFCISSYCWLGCPWRAFLGVLYRCFVRLPLF